ncbi:helix-turn-helix transcriptional regulator [Marinilongibacter aquaticus]|uniref:helix-turn-helix transcriptional regulator n=1 Tax=Marinilongibacter aquaticus TaxID=2975157 RepID=UPI0021BDCFE1|nr:helix-turn-helix transcriptional regulator [Marinilongibacter aquaticus]UBM61027.1 helix-turn-helix transcriptional regulator [Marinilongibacter aquaticus]
MKNAMKVGRAKMGMTQAELAEKVGVARQTIIAVEAGKFVPSTVLALKIAETLACPFEEMFRLEAEDWL